ncbi:enoyl-CoA hydratase [Pseudorhodoferax sp. Leaf274]|uniref:enoyl-CoA hydratase n=1 Tax=Pseudorhodoferax sp. Leaf274 TaxID=1736318 RepID=UPI0009E72480|nr:enoyl-CoA hydratase [Pseudorhodoferax sp. Leaf274]
MNPLQHAQLHLDDAGVATLQIANGTALNILDTPTIVEMTQALRSLARDARLRALVLRGSGEKAFVGGANIHELARLDPDTAVAFITRLHDLCEAVRDFPVPTIARLAGWCMGGGMELAAACDIRIGSTASHFSMPEVRIGIPSVIHANLLARLVGEGRTRWLLLTGAAIDGAQAERWGYLTNCVAPEALDEDVAATLREILANGPESVRAQKALLRAWEAPHLERGLQQSIAVFGQSYAGGEPAAYMQHFFDRKRNA